MMDAIIEKAASEGDAEAQFQLGNYFNSKSVSPQKTRTDARKAFEWYQKSAMQGHVDAQYRLALAYADGIGVCADQVQSAYWLHQAAAQRNAWAQFRLGQFYKKFFSGTVNLEAAITWFQKAADQGHDEARLSLETAKRELQCLRGDAKKPTETPITAATHTATVSFVKTAHETTRPLKIIIVNDEKFMLELLEMVLNQYFKKYVEILTFDDPEKAWEKLLETHPGLLITDDIMPKLGGTEIIQRLANWQIAYPVIMTTAFERAELLMQVQDCASRGLNIKLLNVPFDTETFTKTVEDSLKIPREPTKTILTQQSAAPQTIQAPPNAGEQPVTQLPGAMPTTADVKLVKNQPAVDAKASLIASAIGDIASSLRPFKNNPRQTVDGVVSLWKMARGLPLGRTDTEIKAATDAAFALMFENVMMDNAVVKQLKVTASGVSDAQTPQEKGIITLQTFILLGNPHSDFFKIAHTLGIPMPKEAVNVAMEYHRKASEQKCARTQCSLGTLPYVQVQKDKKEQKIEPLPVSKVAGQMPESKQPVATDDPTEKTITFKRCLASGLWVFILVMAGIESDNILLTIPLYGLPWLLFVLHDYYRASRPAEIPVCILALVLGTILSLLSALPFAILLYIILILKSLF